MQPGGIEFAHQVGSHVETHAGIERVKRGDPQAEQAVEGHPFLEDDPDGLVKALLFIGGAPGGGRGLAHAQGEHAYALLKVRVAPPARIERATLPLGGGCSIH